MIPFCGFSGKCKGFGIPAQPAQDLGLVFYQPVKLAVILFHDTQCLIQQFQSLLVLTQGFADKRKSPIAVNILGIHFQFLEIVNSRALKVAHIPLAGCSIVIQLSLFLDLQELFIICKGFRTMVVQILVIQVSDAPQSHNGTGILGFQVTVHLDGFGPQTTLLQHPAFIVKEVCILCVLGQTFVDDFQNSFAVFLTAQIQLISGQYGQVKI